MINMAWTMTNMCGNQFWNIVFVFSPWTKQNKDLLSKADTLSHFETCLKCLKTTERLITVDSEHSDSICSFKLSLTLIQKDWIEFG